MSYLPCGCFVGAWNSILPPPTCDRHRVSQGPYLHPVPVINSEPIVFTNYEDDLAALLAERDALQAKVDAIDALHQCSQQTYPDEPQWCDDCGCGWPCSTHLALHPEGDTPT